jgi:CHAT domain-containing protein
MAQSPLRNRHLEPIINKDDNSYYTETGIDLGGLLVTPLQHILQNCESLLISPDGQLNRVPFEAIVIDQNHYLIDTHHISYLSTSRDLLRFGVLSSSSVHKSLVIANPNYDLELPASFPDSTANRYDTIQYSSILAPFSSLSGAEKEGSIVGAILGVQPLIGNQATKSALKECHAPQILHIATHGFFFSDPLSQSENENVPGVEDNRISWIAHLANPLLRAGLAFAGANTWFQSKKLPDIAENGVLTAEEITSLDLYGTSLVVLSACDTGLGELRVGEGVFGLRRAIGIAGAKSLIMSLWHVSDIATQELMLSLYQGIQSGMTISNALHQAQISLRMKFPDPYYWSAFIYQGDPLLRISELLA